MIDITCPNCGRFGTVPKGREHSRLVCVKCHSVFHMGLDGRTHLGEPPGSSHGRHGPEPATKNAREKTGFLGGERLSGSRLGMASIVVVLSIAAIGYGLSSERAETLEARARKAANALAHSDLNTLLHYAKKGSVEDVARWQEAIRPKLDELKKASLTSRISVAVLVTNENLNTGSAQVRFFFSPAGVRARPQANVDAPASRQSSEYDATWYLDSSGRWLIDGQSTWQNLVVSR